MDAVAEVPRNTPSQGRNGRYCTRSKYVIQNENRSSLDRNLLAPATNRLTLKKLASALFLIWS